MSRRIRAGNSPSRGSRAIGVPLYGTTPLSPSGHKGWVEIISSVKTILTFSALIVLVTDSGLFILASSLKNDTNQLWAIVLGCLILILLIGAIVFLALKNPEALGIQHASSPHFAVLLGGRTYTAVAPYLSNLSSSDIEEALDWFESRMTASEMDQSPEEIKFQSRFAMSFVRQGRDLLG